MRYGYSDIGTMKCEIPGPHYRGKHQFQNVIDGNTSDRRDERTYRTIAHVCHANRHSAAAVGSLQQGSQTADIHSNRNLV